MVDGIILAGGKSTRMKTNKMLLTINEHPIIWHTLKSIEPTVIITAPEGATVFLDDE